ncbi:hypothetical protein DRP05_12795 [Archaeoglobales archaeon]|nr:MAG: hypothetical protein DRP05_12795 [Archaeoglobales archaeon]
MANLTVESTQMIELQTPKHIDNDIQQLEKLFELLKQAMLKNENIDKMEDYKRALYQTMDCILLLKLTRTALSNIVIKNIKRSQKDGC